LIQKSQKMERKKKPTHGGVSNLGLIKDTPPSQITTTSTGNSKN
jgi:hypothetical protein